VDFQLTIGNQEYTFTQFNDLVECIKQSLAQWNNFEGEKPQIIMVAKAPSDTPSLDVSSSESVDTVDMFGGLPEGWSQAQKEMYTKLLKMAEVEGEEAVRNYIKDNS